MTRVEENTAAIEYATKILETLPNEMQMEAIKIGMLSDISRSLAIIADAITEKQEEKET